jgi:hypothetical protein
MSRGDDNGGRFWTPPQMWSGETVFIVGGGPSLRGVDLYPMLKARRTIGVNYSAIFNPWMEVCWFGDCRWFDWNVDKLKDWPGLRVTCCERLHVVPWIRVMKRSKKGKGIETEPGRVCWNWNSAGSAINFAFHLGSRRIVLLGIDLKRDEQNNTHFHDEYAKVNPRQVSIEYTYKRFIEGFNQIAKDAEQLGVEIINGNPDSRLEAFPRVPLAEAVAL